MGDEAPPNIIQPFIFDSLEWLRCGMTTAMATILDEPRLQFAARLPEIAERPKTAEFETPPVIVGEQVHGQRIAIIGGEANEAGDFETGEVIELPGVDALTTSEKEIAIGVFTADCVPVFLVDPRRRAIGAVHAGWRGVAACILEQGLENMRDAFGTPPDDVWLHLGPAICGRCYEVGPEVFEALGLERPQTKQPIDVRRALSGRARVAGVSVERISVSEHCTRCTGSDLYSHRAGHAQRQVGFIGIRQAGRA